MHVAVIGDGFAGSVAALTAAKRGARVTLFGQAAGASAMWSGVCEVYGPAYDTVDYQEPIGAQHLRVAARAPMEAPAERFTRLVRRRNFHPYARLGSSPADVAASVARAQGMLDVTFTPQRSFSGPAPPFYVANVNGTVRLADGAAGAVQSGLLEASGAYVVVGFEHYPAFAADAVAAQLSAHGLPVETRWIALPDAPLAQNPAAASAILEQLDDEALGDFVTGIANAAGAGTALVPPIFGRTHREHERLWSAVSAACAGRVAETAAIAHSLHGVRAHFARAEACESAGVTLVRDRIVSCDADADAIRTLRGASGAVHVVDAVVLATGRASGGGIRREAPLEEALFGLPLYLEGAPLEGQFRYPPELATRRLLDDHLLFTIGVGVDSTLRPLDGTTKPRFENLYAAGLLLGGTNFTRDGSALGVALVTGVTAGQNAAGGN